MNHWKEIDTDALVQFAQDLIRIPSPSGQEGALAQRLAEEMRRLGWENVFTDRIGNVVGRLGSGEPPILLYNGHMDTVGPGDPKQWTRDPYAAELENGILYGLGAVDMKGALAAMVHSAPAIQARAPRLRGTLYVVGVVQEEPAEGLGMKVLVEEEGIRPDFVVLGEATNLQVSRGQRGRVEIRVTTHGRACHACSPEQGRNAINAAARIIFETELLAPKFLSDPFLGPGTLAVTQIESMAGSRNAIPAACTFYLDRRLTLGETEAKALAEIQHIVARERLKADVAVSEWDIVSYTGYRARVRDSYPAWVVPEDHPLVQAVTQAVKQTLGYKPRLERWAFSTDGVYTMGVAGIPTVGFGPGDEKLAHTVDDHVKVADLVAAAQVYAALAVRMLGE
ncbi:MAG: YgeY family selenium metabolism-linked hydrolase [Chloroflexi bacterium]|nr:YgeY family selenium metabolism-linked hydrolase [Chloroflexota bacterium]